MKTKRTDAKARLPKGLYLRGRCYWLRWTPVEGGEQVRQSLGTEDLAEAIAEANRVRTQIGAQLREVAGSCEAEVEAYVTAQTRRGLSANTMSSRAYVLGAFVKSLDVAAPRLITQRMIQRWYEDLAKENAYTAEAYLNQVKWWMGWLLDRGKISRNLAAEIETPILAPRPRRMFLRSEEVRKLLDACKDPELKFAIYCAAHAGLRKNEIIEARTNWFDLDARLIHVQTTPTFVPKVRENRTIPMSDELHAYAVQFGLGVPFMFRPAETHGASRYRTDFIRSLNTLLDSCGLGEYTFHDLRRTFASLLVSKGVSIYKVAKWLGDTLKTTEETYGHLIPQDAEINAAWS